MKTAIAFLLLGLACKAMGATYYIDFGSGSDANSGTSTNAPWKYCPAMEPFSGSYTHSAGDRFIFRGGVIWPASALPLYITIGGSSNNWDYYGVDTNWFSGASWTRPQFNPNGQHEPNWTGQWHGNQDNTINIHDASYIIFDGFELCSNIWNNPMGQSGNSSAMGMGGNSVFAYGCGDLLFTNLYMHDWVVQLNHSLNSTYWVDGTFGGIYCNNSSGTESAINCQVIGSTNIDPYIITQSAGPGGFYTSGGGFQGLANVIGCRVKYTSQGIFACGNVVSNIVDSTGHSYCVYEHVNAIDFFGNGNCVGNVITNEQGSGTLCYVQPCWGGRNGVINVYNNVFLHNGNNYISVDPQGAQMPNTAQANIWNNTGDVRLVFVSRNGANVHQVVFQNNLVITESTYMVPVDNRGFTPDIMVNNANVVMDNATASADGMGAGNLYKPTSQVSGVCQSGINLTAFTTGQGLSTAGYNGNDRPTTGAWDVGAYQYSASGPSLPYYTLTVNSGSGGGSYVSNSVVGIMADSVSHETFANWSATVPGLVANTNASSTTVTLNTNVMVTANYVTNYVTVTNALPGVGVWIPASDAVIATPFVLANGSLSQAVETPDTNVTSGGEAIFTFTVTNAGNYVVQALVNGPSTANNSFFVNMDAEPESPTMIWDVPVTTGFEQETVSWRGNGTYASNQFVPKVFTLAVGTHQLIIRGREMNTQLESVTVLNYNLAPPPNLRVVSVSQ